MLLGTHPPHAPPHAPRPCSFRLLNLRADMRFALVRNGLEFPLVAAWSEVVRVANRNEPTQGHLALTGRPGYARARLAWGSAALQHGVGEGVGWGGTP